MRRAGSLWDKIAGEANPRINPRHGGGPVCCEDLPAGQFCQPSCVRNIQNDETALAVDMGYYLDFQATFIST